MSNYPRIYSLSTIGIKQHFNANYLMHPNRTDFSGESGSGKSMVSDMIQLILVGSSDFASSTKGNKPREVKGMLLPNKGKSTTRGYMFMNIEVKPSQFLVIGAYIESTSNQSQLFIMQRGYNWDDLLPFNAPVYNHHLIFEDKIFPINEITSKIEDAENGVLKRFKRSEYHQKLYDNGIISYDLTKKDILRSYSSILRSFSRGKGFNMDSYNLKNFLFGSDDQNSIKSKYESEIKNINTDFQDHKRYTTEINLIKDKRSSIKSIKNKYSTFIDLFKQYSNNKFSYWNSKKEQAKKQLIDLNQKHQNAFVEKLLLVIRINESYVTNLDRLEELLKDKHNLRREKTPKITRDSLEKELSKQLNLKADIAKMKSWLKANESNFDSVRNWFNSEFSKSESLRKLNEFTKYLKNAELIEKFEDSTWFLDPKNAKDLASKKENELADEIKRFETLIRFSDIDDEESLSTWAFENLDFPIQHKEESILIYFQQFSKKKPQQVKKGSRYLPFPEELFEHLDIKDESKDGFWLNLDGVYEFIEVKKDRYLNFSDPKEVKKYLLKNKTKLKDQLSKIQYNLTETQRLNRYIQDYHQIDEHLQIYLNKESVSQYKIDQTIEGVDMHLFEKMIETYQNKDTHQKNLEKVQSQLQEIDLSDTKLNNVDQEINSIAKTLFKGEEIKTITSERIDKKKEFLASEIEIKENELSTFISENSLNQELIAKQSKIDFNETEIIALLLEESKIEKVCDELQNSIQSFSSLISTAKEVITNVNTNYFTKLGKKCEPTINENNLFNPDEGESSLKDKLNKAESAFETIFDTQKEKLPNMSFGDKRDIGELSHNLLPTIFQTKKVNFELIEENIEERLNKLTKDIQEIGSRKIEILKKVFKDVGKVYNDYLIQINQIDTDLKKRNITGGNKARLEHKPSIDYPISWLTTFRKQIDNEINNIGIFEELKKEIDINKMMIKAFEKAGGKPDVEPDDLIDPKSYFDLEFNLTLENGEMNSGSNGQTYTGNALLGLARLSLLDDSGKGIKVMPIDEAEGLGGNYDMLHELAKKEKYQIISMGIETTGDIIEGEQYIYIMNENKISDYESYVPPVAILSGGDLIEDIESYINGL